MLEFPKPSKKKKRKVHAPSIMQRRDHTCYMCCRAGDWSIKKDLHEHHIFGGTANRTLSERYGLKVYLCPDHHLTGPDAVHRNKEAMDMLRREAQHAFEEAYPELDFAMIFGKNYV